MNVSSTVSHGPLSLFAFGEEWGWVLRYLCVEHGVVAHGIWVGYIVDNDTHCVRASGITDHF